MVTYFDEVTACKSSFCVTDNLLTVSVGGGDVLVSLKDGIDVLA